MIELRAVATGESAKLAECATGARTVAAESSRQSAGCSSSAIAAVILA